MQRFREYLKEGKSGISKNMKYDEVELKIKDVLKNNDYKTFSNIITDLYNNNMDKHFFRLFVNYDSPGGGLTKAIFKAMK